MQTMIHGVSKVKKRGVDLNLKLVQSSIFTSEDGNEYRKDPVRPTHGLPAMDHVHSHSRPLRRQPPGADFPVVLNIAPLHELVPWKEAKKYWDELLAG
jgi:hypothetical protein